MKTYYPKRLSDLWYHSDTDSSIHLFSDSELCLKSYQLNEVGGFIWTRCTGVNSNKDIALELCEEISEDKPLFGDMLNDIDEFLLSLKELMLVNWENEEQKDVLFVVPPFPSYYSKKAINSPEFSSPPLGIAYLAAVLEQEQYCVDIFDMHILALSPEDILKKIKNVTPKILALSATTPTFPNAIMISKLVKAWDNSIITILGGPHATSLPDECASYDSIDFVIVGEGESTLLELTNYLINSQGELELEDINGLAYKGIGGKILKTKPRELIQNLDILPFPARNLLNLDLYFQKGSIISSRGCPYNCNYCSCSAIWGHTYRRHSINYVLNEVQYLVEIYNIKYIDFHDDTFNLYPKRVFDFCREIERRNMKFSWGCFCRVTNFTYEMAHAMKQAGCDVIQFGVEAGNQFVLNSINKKITLEEVENAIKVASQAKIKKIACGFIIGHAKDSKETVNETIDFGVKLSKMGATNLSLSVLTPYPGTEVYNTLKASGIKLITHNWEQFIFSRVLIETQNLNKNELRELYTRGVQGFLKATIVKE